MCKATFFSNIFIHVCRSNLLRTDTLWDGNDLLVVVTLPVGFFYGSQYTYYRWLGLSRNDNNISIASLCYEELDLYTDKHCGTENKY